MVVRRALLLAVLAVACRTSGGVQPGLTPGVDRPFPELTTLPPSEAITAANKTEDHAEAVDLLWLEGNDRAGARARLERALAQTPDAPQLLLRRALLNFAELYEPQARADLLRTLELQPHGEHAQVALTLLMELNQDRRADRERTLAALKRSGLLSAQAHPPHLVALASALAHRASPDAASPLTRGGWLTELRSIGPLGPIDALTLARFARTPKAQPRSANPTSRTLPAVRRPKITAGDVGGIYSLRLCFDVGPQPVAAVLQSHLPASAFVHVDGELVHQRRLSARRDPALHRTNVNLSAGWHCLRATVNAYSYQRPSFSLLSQQGLPVIRAKAQEPPKGAAVGSVTVQAQEPPKAASSLMDALVQSSLALSSWQEDLDRAQALLHGLKRWASRSAVAHVAWARYQLRARLPVSLSQASLQRALQLDPNYPSALLALARPLSAEASAQALEAINKAQKAAPWSAGPYTLRFGLLKSRSWTAEADQSLQEALKRDASRRLYEDAVRFYERLGQHPKAQKLRAQLQKDFVQSPDKQADRALDRGDLQETLRAARAPGAQEKARHLARASALALSRGDLKVAFELAQEARSADPLSVEAQGKLLLVQLAKGAKQKAHQTLQRLRARGESTLLQEALVAKLHEQSLEAWLHDPWLLETLKVDPLPYIAHLPGTKIPRGQDPADRWAKDQSVLVLDRVVDRVLPDGRALSYRHSINRLQTKEAVDRAGEINLPPAALPLQLRTLKPDGRSFAVDRHEGKEDLSFSGIQPGDAIERRWVTIDEPASPFGGYIRRFYFKSTSPLIRSELVVVVPKSTKVQANSYHGAPEPIVHHTDTLSFYIWRAENVPSFTPEPKAVSDEEYLPFVVVTVGLSPQDALLSNAMLLDRQAQSTFQIRALANRLTQGLKTDRARIDRLFFWVNEEIGLGELGEPDRVLSTKRGERSGLFVAMVRALGLPADLALAKPFRAPAVAPAYPHTNRFTFPLVRLADRWAHLDSSSPWIGKLPPYLRGGQYLLYESQDKILARPFREEEIDSWTIESLADLRVGPSGKAEGEVSIKLPGTYGSQLRVFLEQARKEEVERHFQGWLAAILPGAKLDSFEANKAPGALQIVSRVTIENFMTPDGRNLIAESLFDTPIGSSSLGLPSLATYLQAPKRKSPLLLEERAERMTIKLRFPEKTLGPVEHPKTFRHITNQGSFMQAFFWDQQTKEIKLIREERLPSMRLSPKAYDRFRAIAQEVLQSTRNRLVLEF